LKRLNVLKIDRFLKDDKSIQLDNPDVGRDNLKRTLEHRVGMNFFR